MMLAKTVEKEIDLLERVAAVLRGEVTGERECALIANQVHELIYAKRKDLVQIKRREELRQVLMWNVNNVSGSLKDAQSAEDNKLPSVSVETLKSTTIKPFEGFVNE